MMQITCQPLNLVPVEVKELAGESKLSLQHLMGTAVLIRSFGLKSGKKVFSNIWTIPKVNRGGKQFV